MDKYDVIKSYRDNEKLRASFNELAKKTFGINFEDLNHACERQRLGRI